jgi:hypothetical protein
LKKKNKKKAKKEAARDRFDSNCEAEQFPIQIKNYARELDEKTGGGFDDKGYNTGDDEEEEEDFNEDDYNEDEMVGDEKFIGP